MVWDGTGAPALIGRGTLAGIPASRGVPAGNVTVDVVSCGGWAAARKTWAIAVDLGVAKADAAAAPRSKQLTKITKYPTRFYSGAQPKGTPSVLQRCIHSDSYQT